MSPDLKELLALLNSHEIRYLVTGGYALAAHGSPRYTKDLDLWVDATAGNLGKLADVLQTFGFAEAAIKSQRLAEGRRLLQVGSEPNRVDFLNFASGVEFAPCYASRFDTQIDGVDAHVIGKEEFIQNKLAAGRLSDLADLERLGVKPDVATIERALQQAKEQ